MEELKYIVEDNILAELLGVHNFSNKEAAILELIKNSYDAGAQSVTINICKDKIVIIDSGKGMDIEDIKKHWMHIGKSEKGYEIIDNNGEKRVLSGSKGIGRFALARLGEEVEMNSKKEKKLAVCWRTDWNTSSLEEQEKNQKLGTEIKILKLRDKWTKVMAEKLADYLGRTYCDDKMVITLFFEEKKIEVKKYFENPQIGKNFATEIQLNYNAKEKKLYYKFVSDEFKEQAEKFSKTYNIYENTDSINIFEEFENVTFDDEIEDLEKTLQDIGDFSANLFFGIERVLAGDEERFLYKRKGLEDMYSTGIILYRNAFSISSYEGKKDWLGLGKRSRKSPAAATHPTGSWRVRENQISGNVKIDKKNNKNLKDLSNRQGLDENIYYQIFVNIILSGISEFERYRQTIIREINKKNKKPIQKKALVSERVVRNPNEIKNLTKQEEGKLISEIKEFQKENKEYKRNIQDTEKRYKYDVRILNVLATSGLKATSIAHEMKNDRNKLDATYDYIVDALKAYDLWETLNTPEHTEYADMNVPEMLMKNKETGNKLIQFMDVMLEEIEKRQFYAEEYDINLLLQKIKNNWEKDYSWVDINILIEDEIKYTISEDIINVVFDNLVLNSVQQNEKNKKLDIDIKIRRVEDLLQVDYSDSGIGLTGKFLKNPRKILEPHETSRKKGHGLGMWIVNNTLIMSGGEVLDIPINGGFNIIFTVGGKL